MKKTDIAMIILIAGISVFVAYFVMGSVLSGLKTKPETIKTADPISTSVVEPDPSVFNSGAINPTVQVNIGSGAGQ
ncbi:MAG TPA: hypothetical protein VFQ70_03345 [Candidatus Saccharimonadaceae bacterium]|nr:hypothetical protein [Candidatus Saccharimonadaceae bacterium]